MVKVQTETKYCISTVLYLQLASTVDSGTLVRGLDRILVLQCRTQLAGGHENFMGEQKVAHAGICREIKRQHTVDHGWSL